MATAVPYTVLLLSLVVAVHECERLPQITSCASPPPCFDLFILQRMTRHVSKGVSSADGENIFLKSQTFDKIRKKKDLHSCVIEKIVDFCVQVLSVSHGMNYLLELISMMDTLKSCVYKMNKRCAMLYQKAAEQTPLEILEADMTAEEVAIYQLQKINSASERLYDKNVQERVLDELKSLHNYIPGRGFRKTSV
ncbi:uncharacterized protein si:ch211-266a5.12 [Hoplias malabaricus]|uniref:uncharacterized protein si:ch211-266a5.12 n=1 Tax=Hoplias malabaricus TaxID=27720 RepID=UPI0034623F90